jgi:hypothetical protein
MKLEQGALVRTVGDEVGAETALVPVSSRCSGAQMALACRVLA